MLLISSGVFITFLCYVVFFKISALLRGESVFKLTLISAMTLWYVTPFVLSIIQPENLDTGWAARFPIDNFFESYLTEITFLLILLTVFFKILRYRNSNAKQPSYFGFEKLSIVQRRFFIIAIIVVTLSGLGNSGQYNTASSEALYSQKTILATYIGWLSGFFLSYVVAVLFYVGGPKNIIGVGYAVLFFYSVSNISGGARIWLLMPLVAWYIRQRNDDVKYNTNKSSRGSYVVTILSVFLCLFMASLLPTLGRLRSDDKRISFDEVISDSGNNAEMIGSVIFSKLDGFSTSSILLEEEGPGAGGIMPYIGSLLIFIPRAIWAERPVACSVDGTEKGHTSRYMVYLSGVKSDALVLGGTPAQIAIWQLGWVGGLIVFVSIGVVYLFTMRWLLVSDEMSYRIMGIHMIAFPSFSQVFISPDLAIKVLVETSVFLAILRVIINLTNSRGEPIALVHANRRKL